MIYTNESSPYHSLSIFSKTRAVQSRPLRRESHTDGLHCFMSIDRYPLRPAPSIRQESFRPPGSGNTSNSKEKDKPARILPKVYWTRQCRSTIPSLYQLSGHGDDRRRKERIRRAIIFRGPRNQTPGSERAQFTASPKTLHRIKNSGDTALWWPAFPFQCSGSGGPVDEEQVHSRGVVGYQCAV